MLVSFGDCAVTGNVPAIRNQLGLGNAENVLQRAYIENAQNNPGVPKSRRHRARRCSNACMPVHEVVHVEYFLPGCPPPADRIKALMVQVLERRRAEAGRAAVEIWITRPAITSPSPFPYVKTHRH